VTTGDQQPQEAPRQGDGADSAYEDHEALVARVREELDAARRRVRDAWAQYQRRAAEEHAREAVAVSPLITALFALVS
jgi:hypothetical protein